MEKGPFTSSYYSTYGYIDQKYLVMVTLAHGYQMH